MTQWFETMCNVIHLYMCILYIQAIHVYIHMNMDLGKLHIVAFIIEQF